MSNRLCSVFPLFRAKLPDFQKTKEAKLPFQPSLWLLGHATLLVLEQIFYHVWNSH